MKFFVLLFFLSSNIFAEDLNEEVKLKSNSDQVDISQTSTSSENRKQVNYQLAFHVLGAEFSGLRNNFSFNFGYFYNEKILMFLRYTTQNDSGDPDKRSSTSDYPQTTKATSLGSRFFIGNSFNVSGLAYLRSLHKYDQTVRLTYNYEDVGFGWRLGNEWQWENFLVGCDWFGLNRTVFKMKNNFPNSGFGIDKEITFALLNFYFGYAF